MILLNIIEEIKQSFPDLSEAQIKLEVNKKYKEFAHKTRLIKSSYDLDLTTDTYYPLNSDVDLVYDITQKDSNGQNVDQPMKVRIDNKTIYFYDYFGNELTQLETDASTITVYYYVIPDDLADDSDEPEFPEQFHSAVVNGTLSTFYAKFPTEVILPTGNIGKLVNLNLAKYWSNEFEKQILDGKRHSNMNGNSL